MQRRIIQSRASSISHAIRQNVSQTGKRHVRMSSNLTEVETNTLSAFPQVDMPTSRQHIPKGTSIELIKALDNVAHSRKFLGITDEMVHSYTANMKEIEEEHKLAFQLTKEEWRRNTRFVSNEIEQEELSTHGDERGKQLHLKELELSIIRKNKKVAAELFRRYTMSQQMEFSLKHFKLYKKMMSLMAPHLNPCYDIFSKFEALPRNFEQKGVSIEEAMSDYHQIRGEMLHHMIAILGSPIGLHFKNRPKYEAIIKNTIDTVQGLPPSELKYDLIPKLMQSLMSGKGNWGKVRDMEISLWLSIIDSIKKDPSIVSERNLFRIEKILEHSTYQTKFHLHELPFVKLLQAVVNGGSHLRPNTVMNVLQNEFPFLKDRNLEVMLRLIAQLQTKNSGFQYHIDEGTLEHISAAAAKKGRSDIILQVWEHMELRRSSNDESSPVTLSRSLYESAVQAFARSNKKEDHMVLNLLAEMEEQGFEVNRALLTSIARSLRNQVSVKRLDNMTWMLKNFKESDPKFITVKPTSAGLNCILACYGQLGEVQKALEIFDEFGSLGCSTTPETFEFIMESIRYNVITAVPPFLQGVGKSHVNSDNYEEWKISQLDTAEAIVIACLEEGHRLHLGLVNNYIDIICAVGELGKAKEFLAAALESKEEFGNGFSPKCFSVLALNYAQRGHFRHTEEVIQMSERAGVADQFPKHVMERITTLQRNF